MKKVVKKFKAIHEKFLSKIERSFGIGTMNIHEKFIANPILIGKLFPEITTSTISIWLELDACIMN